ncbi:hypothetical protein MGN70_006953 [Eutypa lata]|nr:hypothetical protein MGN70_006953 [Eutypa lata]
MRSNAQSRTAGTSCEYQETAGDIATYCLNPDLEGIPFYPPPDDAPGACSCNLGKLLTSIYQTSAETESCGANGEEIVSGLTSNDEIQTFSEACICCSQSATQSAADATPPPTSAGEANEDGNDDESSEDDADNSSGQGSEDKPDAAPVTMPKPMALVGLAFLAVVIML